MPDTHISHTMPSVCLIFALQVRFYRPTPQRSRALLAVRPAAERDPSVTMSEPP